MVNWEVPANYMLRQAAVTCKSSQLPVPTEHVEPPGLDREALVKEVGDDNSQVRFGYY